MKQPPITIRLKSYNWKKMPKKIWEIGKHWGKFLSRPSNASFFSWIPQYLRAAFRSHGWKYPEISKTELRVFSEKKGTPLWNLGNPAYFCAELNQTQDLVHWIAATTMVRRWVSWQFIGTTTTLSVIDFTPTIGHWSDNWDPNHLWKGNQL